MPQREQNGSPDIRAASSGQGAGNLFADLRQPLTAASNYVGTARSIILSGDVDQVAVVVDLLGKAGDQILLAGQMVGKLQHRLEIEEPLK